MKHGAAAGMIAYKILLGSELAVFKAKGCFNGTPSDLKEGFIHLSSADQIGEVVKKHYANARDAYVLAVDLDTMGTAVRLEDASNGKAYPHLYDTLMLASVIGCSTLKLCSDGFVEIPKVSAEKNL